MLVKNLYPTALLAAFPAAAQQILTSVATPTYALVQSSKAAYQDYSGSTASITEIDLGTRQKRVLLPAGLGGAQPYHYEYYYAGADMAYVPFSLMATYPLHHMNVQTGATRSVSSHQGWKETVWVGGGVIVWADYRHKTASDQNSEIYMAPAAGGSEVRLTSDTRYQTKPVTDGRRIAWLDYAAGSRAQVVLYTIQGGATITIAPSDSHQDNPRLDGDYVIWEDYRNAKTDTTNVDIYAYRIGSGQVTPLCTAPGFQGKPFLHNQGAVWDDHRNVSGDNKNVDIYGYDFVAGREVAISTHAAYQSSPVHYLNRIVWFQVDGSTMNLYSATLSFNATSLQPLNRRKTLRGPSQFIRVDGRLDFRPVSAPPAFTLCRHCVVP